MQETIKALWLIIRAQKLTSALSCDYFDYIVKIDTEDKSHEFALNLVD